jgi:hypothetical protein
VVGNENCLSFLTRKLQIPENPLRPTSSRRRLKCIKILTAGWRSSVAGVVWVDTTTVVSRSANLASRTRKERMSVRPAVRIGPCLRGIKDASRRHAVTSATARPSLTAPPRVARTGRAPGNVRRRHRSSAGQSENERPHDASPKPDKLISYRHIGLTEPPVRYGCGEPLHSTTSLDQRPTRLLVRTAQPEEAVPLEPTGFSLTVERYRPMT